MTRDDRPNPRRRVLFVTTTYPLQPGDAIPSFVADLAEGLVRDHGIAVRVVAPHHASAARHEVVNGVEVERFPYAGDPERQCVAYGSGIPDNLKNFPRAKWQLPRFLAAMTAAVWRNAEWADLIHAHWVEPALLAMAGNRAARPTVLSVHSLKPRASRVARFTLGRANRVLFNSQYTMGQAREKGYFPCHGRVVYQGYDERLFGRNQRTGEIRARLNVPNDATVIVALGRFIEVKGLHVLARAADRILGGRPDAHLIIAGDGPMRAEIDRLIAAATCRDRIHMPGAVPHGDVAKLFADADLFVNPGVVDSGGRAEGLGITTIEAMASGLACVGSRVGGISETIVDGRTGLLVPPGDEPALAAAINRLLDDPPTRRAMGDAARQRAADHFTWRVLAGEVASIYRDVLGEARPQTIGPDQTFRAGCKSMDSRGIVRGGDVQGSSDIVGGNRPTEHATGHGSAGGSRGESIGSGERTPVSVVPSSTMPRRILFVTTTYPIKPGDSIPSFVADLAQALVRDAGLRVRVIAPHHPRAAMRETVNGVEIERFQYAMNPARQCVAYGGGIPDNLKNFPRAKWQLPGFFLGMAAAVWRNAEWADLIHAHWIEPAFLAMNANHLSLPTVVSVHSLKPRASRLQRHTLRRVGCALFNSHYTMAQAREQGYFPCRGRVMYQGYDDQLFGLHSRGNGARRRLGIAGDATVIMGLGRLIEMKGLHVLARAADRILLNRPNAHLVIAGDGPLRGDIRASVAASASRNRIHLTGALPRQEVARLLADSDLYVNPGVVDAGGRAEALGITTLEAMASGLACVGSRVGGIAETIVDRSTGLLVEPGNEVQLADAVGKLADDPPLRARMGEAGRRRAKDEFTWTVLAAEVAKVYRQVARRPTD